MASRAKARQAKDRLRSRIGGRKWLRGIGLEGSGADFCVRVNVDVLTPEVRSEIPPRVDDVEVRVDSVGNIRASSEND
jgi:hypothetical protein